jgi:CubicO group peptidase (beta-lactamase class C family)
VGVVQDGDFVFQKGYGSANLDYETPITSQSVFYIASTSKQFTAASIALLALRGQLSLDDDIRKHVPEIPEYGQTITIRHLVHHTSGLRDYLTLRGLTGKSFEDFFDNAWGIELLSRQRELNFEPGSENLYSNSGYLLLAEIVERVSGQTLQEFGRENLFGPLDMNSTHWGEDRQKVVPNRVVSYGTRPDSQYRRWVKNFHAKGDGNLLTTVEDLLHWDRFFYDQDPSWTELRELILTRGVLNNGDTLGYAFGLAHGEYRDKAVVSHGGGFLGFRTEMMRFPNDRFTAIVLCNLGTANPGRLSRSLADIWLFDDTGESVAAARAAPVTVTESISLSRSEMERYTGIFSHPDSPFGDVVVDIEGSELNAAIAGLSIRLLPVARDTFNTVGAPTEGQLVFATDAEQLALRILAPGIPDLPFTKSEFALMAPEELAALAGDYYSVELDVSYEIVMEEKLNVILPDGSETDLNQSGNDEFGASSWKLNLDRDAAGAITGFTLNAGRVRNLRFVRN